MACIHLIIDEKDRQWTPPPKMPGVYFATLDVRELSFTNAEIEAIAESLVRNLLRAVSTAPPVDDKPIEMTLGLGGQSGMVG